MTALATPPSRQTDAARRSVAGNAAFLGVSQVATWVLGVAAAVALPRHLGPATLGQLRLAISLWAVAGVVVAAGSHLLLTKEFAQDAQRARALAGPATSLQLLMYGAAWIGVMAFSVVAGYSTDALVVIAIVGGASVLAPFAGTGRAALSGLERMEYVAVADIATKVLYVGLVLALIVAGSGVRVLAASSVLPAAVSTGLLWFFLRRFDVSLRPRLRGLRDVARRSRSFMAIDVTLVAYQQIDVIVISLLVRSEALGWYSTADGLFGSLLFLPSILMMALFPVFSRLHTAEPGESRALFAQCFRLLILVAVPVGLGTFAIASPLAVLLFGEAFAGAGPVLAVMGLVATLTYLTILLGRYAVATDRQTFWVWLMVVATVLTVGLDLVLVPAADRLLDNGAVGGAVAYLVTESLMLAVGIRVLAPELLCRATFVRAGACLVAGAAMVAGIWPLRSWTIVWPVLAGACIYVLAVAVLRVPDHHELQMMRRAAAQVGGVVSRLGRTSNREVAS